MNSKTMILFFSCVGVLFADRTLSTQEISAFAQNLTREPVKTWVPCGTIKARHMEYYDFGKDVFESIETVQTDGDRYLVDILLLAHNSDQPGAGNEGLQADQDYKMNKHRIFCWNGTTHTRYYEPAHYAVVSPQNPQDPQDSFVSMGPFSAGIVPWGFGIFTGEKFMQYRLSGREVIVDNQRQIHLCAVRNDPLPAVQMNFVFDPAKNNAVLYYCFSNLDDTFGIEQKYSEYKMYGNYWIPTMITIERYQKQDSKKEIGSYEDWKIDSVDLQSPAEEVFSVKFKNGDVVEYQPSGKLNSLLYCASDKTDILALMEDKISLSIVYSPEQRNCATDVISYIAKKYLRTVSQEKLESLIMQNKMTTLYLMRKTLEELGLYCSVVQISLDALREVKNSWVVLHLPASNHYIILDHIDDQNVWTIDLSSRKFYWKTPIKDFLMQWTNGTALVVSEKLQDISIQGNPIDAESQQRITGGDISGYACTDRIEVTHRLVCSQLSNLMCGGCYYKYYERYGCKEEPNGGYCYGDGMIGYDYTYCINSLIDPSTCQSNGKWFSRYIRACQ